MAIAGLVLAVGGWYHTGHLLLVIGGPVLGAGVPFTPLVIYPTNHRLLASTLAPESPEAGACCAAGAGCTRYARDSASWPSSSCWLGFAMDCDRGM